MRKSIVYYTAGEVSPKIGGRVRSILRSTGLPIVCSSLDPELEFGNITLYFPDLKKSPLTQFRQILAALEVTNADVVYFCEDDILYHPSHFDFIPPTNSAYYYNTNIWKIWLSEGIATYEDGYKPLSGLVGDYQLMLGHYRRRVAKILRNQADTIERGGVVEREGYSKHMGYEPGGHMKPRGVDEYPMIEWKSTYPIVDIRHENNLTKGKRRPDDYHEPQKINGWRESEEIPWWGRVNDLVGELV